MLNAYFFLFLPTFIHLYPNPRVNVNNRVIIWKTTGAVVMTITLCSSITFPFLHTRVHLFCQDSITHSLNVRLSIIPSPSSIQSNLKWQRTKNRSSPLFPNLTHTWKIAKFIFSVEVSGRHWHEQACKKNSSKSHVQSIQSINLFLSQTNCYFLLTKPLLSYVPI